MMTRAGRLARALLAFIVATLLAACAASTPTPAPSAATPSTTASVPAPTPARTLELASPSAAASPSALPIVIDTDLSSDDIMAIAYLAREPTVDIRAITVSGTGLVRPSAGAQNVLGLLKALGRTDIPVAPGAADPIEGSRSFPAEWRTGAGSAYGIALDPTAVTPGIAVDLLRSTLADAETPVTVVALGPMTNLAQTLAADPAIVSRIGGIHAMAGAIDVTGNVASDGGDAAATGAEWNLWIDPVATRAVFASGIQITLVPLDATNDLPVTKHFYAALESDHAAAGADIAYELLTRNPGFIGQGNYFWDQLAATLLATPGLADFEDATVRVEESGPDSGRLVRDAGGTLIRFAVRPDVAAFEEAFLAGLRRGAPREKPFVFTGSMTVRFDGTRCDDGSPGTVAPGDAAVRFEATGGDTSGLAVLHFKVGSSWQDLLDYFATAPDPTNQPSFVDLGGFATVEGAGASTVVVAMTPGTWGMVCFRDHGDGIDVIPAAGPFEVTD